MFKKDERGTWRMESGLKAQDALDAARDFLETWQEFLQKHQPQAVNTINDLQSALDSLGTDFQEMIETDVGDE